MNPLSKQAALRRVLTQPLILSSLARGRRTPSQIKDALASLGVPLGEHVISHNLADLRRAGLVVDDPDDGESDMPRRLHMITSEGAACLAGFREHWHDLTRALGA